MGYLLINCSVGDLFDFSHQVCNHNDCCCFYHCILKTENDKISEFKLKSFLSDKTHSEEFINFLCYLTTYKFNKKNLFYNIKNHSWFENKNKINTNKIYVTLSELLQLCKNMEIRDNQFNKEKKTFESLIESVTLILTTAKGYFDFHFINKLEQIFTSDIINYDMEELSNNFQSINKEEMINMLKNVFNIFLNNKN